MRQVIAVAAAHHRFVWIHPFYDGNGRVVRLMSHAMLKRLGVGSSLWSVARGLARHRDTPELMRYYWDTIDACVPPAAILAAMTQAGLVEVRRHVELGIFSEYCARVPEAAPASASAG